MGLPLAVRNALVPKLASNWNQRFTYLVALRDKRNPLILVPGSITPKLPTPTTVPCSGEGCGKLGPDIITGCPPAVMVMFCVGPFDTRPNNIGLLPDESPPSRSAPAGTAITGPPLFPSLRFASTMDRKSCGFGAWWVGSTSCYFEVVDRLRLLTGHPTTELTPARTNMFFFNCLQQRNQTFQR